MLNWIKNGAGPRIRILMSKKRQNTKLESEGAEFLILGHLLIEGIPCYKSYVNHPGFDLMAVNYRSGRCARIQVKSRWATDYDRSFPIKNFDCDFVAHVALNRGIRFRKTKKAISETIKDPEFFIFPVNVIKAAQNPRSKWGKVTITNIPGYQRYKNNWSIVSDFLAEGIEGATPAPTGRPSVSNRG